QMGQQPDMLWNANMVTNGMALTTAYAQSKGAYTHLGAAPWRAGNGGWWTRSAGRTSTLASIVSTNGNTGANDSVAYANRGPRPALWVNLESVID
ncbi:MAG: DUF6273 domain-containing protein, partial [Oscillospiraceae bacterium]|nr:DUF6273 domain-containing protein [Oscillospiraceae bacterium]